jgi:hypothetical protein
MLIRQKFVTNSSSVSFIAWGLIVSIDEKIKIDYVKAYQGNDNVALRKDGTGHYLIYSKISLIDMDEYNQTIALDEEALWPTVADAWTTAVKDFATEMGLNVEGLKPCWFFTKYGS